jgi:hypothetical protein
MLGDAGANYLERMLDAQRAAAMAQMARQQSQSAPPSNTQDQMGQYSWTLARPTPFAEHAIQQTHPWAPTMQPVSEQMVNLPSANAATGNAGYGGGPTLPQMNGTASGGAGLGSNGGILGRLIQSLNPVSQSQQTIPNNIPGSGSGSLSSASPTSAAPPAMNPTPASAPQPQPQPQRSGPLSGLAGGEFGQRFGDMLAGWSQGTTPQESIAYGNKALWAGREKRADQARADKILEAQIQSAVAAGVPENVARALALGDPKELAKTVDTWWIKQQDTAATLAEENKTQKLCLESGIAPAICRFGKMDLIKDELTASRQAKLEAEKAALEAKKPIAMKPSDTLVTSEGKPLFTAPASPAAPYSLSPGEQRRGPDNALLAENPKGAGDFKTVTLLPPEGLKVPPRPFDVSDPAQRAAANRYIQMGWRNQADESSSGDTWQTITTNDGVYSYNPRSGTKIRLGDRPERNEGEGRDFMQENKLRQSYFDQAKPFIDLRTNYQRINAAAQDDTGASDIALVYAFMKMLDPTSVVREGEFATAQNAGGVDAKVIATYNNILNGQRLAPQVRGEFIQQAKRQFNEQWKSYEPVRKTYQNLAKQYNLDPDRTAPDLSYGVERPDPGPPVPGAPIQGAPAQNGPNGPVGGQIMPSDARQELERRRRLREEGR